MDICDEIDLLGQKCQHVVIFTEEYPQALLCLNHDDQVCDNKLIASLLLGLVVIPTAKYLPCIKRHSIYVIAEFHL